MLKKILIIPILLFSIFAFAQQADGQYIHKHLTCAGASIVSGYMFKNNINNVYVNGNLEYYLDNAISIRGDVNWLMGSNGFTSDSMRIKDNHSLMIGALYHFHTKNHFDPYFMIQPGFAFTSSFKEIVSNSTDNSAANVYYKGVISPLGSAGLGFNYYFQRFAHLFLETRYVYGNHLSDAPKPISLQELRVTFGLGFNLF